MTNFAYISLMYLDINLWLLFILENDTQIHSCKNMCALTLRKKKVVLMQNVYRSVPDYAN